MPQLAALVTLVLFHILKHLTPVQADGGYLEAGCVEPSVTFNNVQGPLDGELSALCPLDDIEGTFIEAFIDIGDCIGFSAFDGPSNGQSGKLECFIDGDAPGMCGICSNPATDIVTCQCETDNQPFTTSISMNQCVSWDAQDGIFICD